jgi:hypothetical protein
MLYYTTCRSIRCSVHREEKTLLFQPGELLTISCVAAAELSTVIPFLTYSLDLSCNSYENFVLQGDDNVKFNLL